MPSLESCFPKNLWWLGWNRNCLECGLTGWASGGACLCNLIFQTSETVSTLPFCTFAFTSFFYFPWFFHLFIAVFPELRSGCIRITASWAKLSCPVCRTSLWWLQPHLWASPAQVVAWAIGTSVWRTWVIKCPHGSHHPTIRYMVYNGYYKVIF